MENAFIAEDSYAYIMNSKSSVDIDDELDFQLASLLLDKKKCILMILP